jgi:type II secretory pathway component PulF
MKKYLVRFTTKNGEYDKEWCHANSTQEAEEIIRQDHWNIKSIDLVEEI